jgi:hypothetical protein
MPALDTSYYDGQIAIAASMGGPPPAGDVDISDYGGNLYVKGDASFDGVSISGQGLIVASGTLTIEGGSTAGNGVSFISGDMAKVTTDAAIGEGSVLYGARGVALDSRAVIGSGAALLTPGTLSCKTRSAVAGLVYAGGQAAMETKSRISGGLVAGASTEVQPDCVLAHDTAALPGTPPAGLEGGGAWTGGRVSPVAWEEI